MRPLTVARTEFAKKTGATGYGSFSTSWATASGSPGDQTMKRGESVALPAKHVGGIKFRLTYRDNELGQAQTIEDSVSWDADRIAEVTEIHPSFNDSGQTVVGIVADEDALGGNAYITVGDGSTPSDPLATSNDASISLATRRSGSVTVTGTGVQPTLGNEISIKAAAEDSAGNLGPVQLKRVVYNNDFPGGRLTATNALFIGNTTFQANTGAERANISAAGNDGVMRFRDSSDVISLRLAAGGSGGTRVESTNGRHLNIDGDGGLTIHIGGGNALWVNSPQGTTSRILTLHKDLSSRSVTGTTTETTLETVTVPADALGGDGGLRIRGTFNITGGNSFKVMRVKFGGTTIATLSPGNVTGGVAFQVEVWNDGSTSSQVAHGFWLEGTNGRDLTEGSASIDTTSSADITITGDLDNTGDEIELQMSFVEFLSTAI